MNKKQVKIGDFEKKELKQLKSHMNYMYQDLRKWGIKSCDTIDLFPEVKDSKKKLDEKEKDEKHIGYWIIQGTIKSETGFTFNFQIVREHDKFKSNGQPQYKVILQYGKAQVIETYPQTNPDLKAILLNYLYTPNPIKMDFALETKAKSVPAKKKPTNKKPPVSKPTPSPIIKSDVKKEEEVKS